MLHSPSSALRPLVTNTAIVIRRDAAVVMCVAVGDIGVSTDTGGVLVGTNVTTHIVLTSILIIGTFHVVVTDNLTLRIGGVGWTVLGTCPIAGF